MHSNRHPQTFGHLGAGATVLAKLCLIVGMCSIFLIMLASGTPDPIKDVIHWIQRIIVALTIGTLLVIFFKYPLPSRRPEGLTEVLVASTALFLAAWVTGVWPGVFAALLIPLLVIGSSITERLRRD